MFQRWINWIQMSMSFDEFKDQITPKKQKSEEEIFENVKNILTLFREGR